MKNKLTQNSTKGLHLWSVHIRGPNKDTMLWVTSRRANSIEVARKTNGLLKSSEELEPGNSVDKIVYKGTIDA